MHVQTTRAKTRRSSRRGAVAAGELLCVIDIGRVTRERYRIMVDIFFQLVASGPARHGCVA
jgi:hypothetical protein